MGIENRTYPDGQEIQPFEDKYLDRWPTCQAPIPVFETWLVLDTPGFAELGLEREPVTCRLLFAPAPLAELCRYNGLDPAQMLADEDPQ